MKKQIILITLFLGAVLGACAQDNNQVFMFSYFTGNGEDGLHLAYSHDGYQWKALNEGKSFLTPRVGNDKLMRDPCIIKGPEGNFHMVWTVSWEEKGIGYAWSEDLIHWSEQKYVPVMEHEPKAKNCWAPELFYDQQNEQFLIVWATTIPGRFPETDNQSNEGPPHPGNNHRLYHTTIKDFEEFSETEIFYNQGFNVIDGTIERTGSKYILFLKDETNKPFTPQKNIRYAVSDHATGPYGEASEPITGDYWAEGPTATKIDSEWVVYFDKYRKGKMGAVRSDDLKQWTDISEKVHFPEGTRHGTVFKVSPEVFNRLEDKTK